MENIFSVSNNDLNRLSPAEAVGCFSELLWAEATALGIGKNLISIPSAINVKDGGIDAEVKETFPSSGQGDLTPQNCTTCN